MFRLSAVVILYHPDATCSDNIKSYLEHVDILYVIDNSPQKNDFPADIIKSPKVKYFSDLENRGIAARLNEALQYSAAAGYDWLLTMDQDSSFEKDALLNYKKCIAGFPNPNEVAMFGVEYGQKAIQEDCRPVDAPNLITSGSIVNIKTARELNGFDENLFIDEVDFDYCYKAKLKGLRIVKFENIHLSHRIGEQGQYRSLKNLKQTNRALHSPVRMYYMVRNHFYVQEKYGKRFPEIFKARRKDIFTSIKNNLIYGGEKMKALRHIFLGYADYRRGKFGKK